MRVDWFLELVPGAGSAADGGADARVTAVPGAGTTTMELSRWDAARGWVTGPPPAFQVVPADPVLDLAWGAPYADLGIAPGTRVGVVAVSQYRSFTGLGTQTSYADRAPDAGALALTAAGTPPAASTGCRRAAAVRARPQGGQARPERHGEGPPQGTPDARRRRARVARACPTPAAPGTAAPGGCHLETRPTYVIGADGRIRLQQRVVSVCD